MPQFGVINEVGDLGLGFDVLTEDEQETIKKSSKDNQETNEAR